MFKDHFPITMEPTNRFYDFYINDDVRLYNYHVNDSPYPYLNGYSLPLGQRGHVTDTSLYGRDLTNLCKKTQDNISRLKGSLSHIDPCYEYGQEHWHFDKNKPVREAEVELPEHMRPKWRAQKTVFSTQRQMDHINWKKISRDEPKTESPGPVNKFCYLCTTLEEHQRHLARRGLQLKAKEKRKPRVDFIVPLPATREKRPDVQEEEENLYKVTVQTGTKVNAATTANVFIKLKGDEGRMKPRKLHKRTSVNFSFGRGTKETFYIKTPKLGTLRSLVISHDGLEKKDSWYLEEIEVHDVTSEQTYVFQCGQWLSLYVGDCAVKRELRAEILEKYQKEYLVSVFTGNKTLAGTDAHVTMTLCGKRGLSRKLRLSKTEKGKKTLQRNGKDTFTFVVDDIGPLTRIRLEHDNTGKSPDWLLEKIVVEDSDLPDRPYLFPCGQWIPDDDEQHESRIIRDLYHVGSSAALRAIHKAGQDEPGDHVTYEVTVVTGDVWGAGTDARVYLMIIGKQGKTRDIELDDKENNFERGKTDKFKVRAADVGAVKKIRVRHDNTSLAAGWFLDRITLRRFFTKQEMGERMNKMEDDEDDRALRRASEITGVSVRGRDVDTARRAKRRTSGRDSDGSESEESEDSDKEGKRRHHKNDKRRPETDNKTSKKGRRLSKYLSNIDEETEPDSTAERKERKRNRSKNKKKYTYGGIETWATESETDSDRKSSRYGDRKLTKNRHKSKHYQSDDSEDDKRNRKKNWSKSKYLESDSSDDDKKKKTKKKQQKNKKWSKYDSDSTDEDKKRKHSRRRKSFSSSDSDSAARGRSSSRASKTRLSDSSSSTTSDSDEEHKEKKKKKSKKEQGRRKIGKGKDSEDSDDSPDTGYGGRLYERWREDRVPFCDEYEFVCRRWLASDEDDRKIERELRPTSVTTFYRKT